MGSIYYHYTKQKTDYLQLIIRLLGENIQLPESMTRSQRQRHVH